MIKDDCDVEAQFQGWEFLSLPMPQPECMSSFPGRCAVHHVPETDINVIFLCHALPKPFATGSWTFRGRAESLGGSETDPKHSSWSQDVRCSCRWEAHSASATRIGFKHKRGQPQTTVWSK